MTMISSMCNVFYLIDKFESNCIPLKNLRSKQQKEQGELKGQTGNQFVCT